MDKLVIDCSGGARKAQLANMLLEHLDEERRGAFVREFNALGLPGISGELEGDGTFVVLSDGRTEAQVRHWHDHDRGHDHSYDHGHAHEHRTMQDVRGIVEASSAPPALIDDVMGVYSVLAAAEAKAHDSDEAHVHFHEVGNDFAIGYITAFGMLLGMLLPDVVNATPIATGFGYVDCAHGRLSIPAPATANILEGLPHYAGDVEGELCTPTGAAIVRHFAEGFVG